MKTISVFIVLVMSLFSLSLHAAPTASVAGENVLDATPVKVDADSKKGLVVVFLSAVCPCSNSHVDELKKLSQEHPDFAFVGVHSNADEDKETTQAYFKQAALPFPVIQDSKAVLADEFKALKTPHSFVVLRDGTTAYQGGVSSSSHFAKADKKYLREALNDLAQGRKVETPEGRTLGCVIERAGEKNVW